MKKALHQGKSCVFFKRSFLFIFDWTKWNCFWAMSRNVCQNEQWQSFQQVFHFIRSFISLIYHTYLPVKIWKIGTLCCLWIYRAFNDFVQFEIGLNSSVDVEGCRPMFYTNLPHNIIITRNSNHGTDLIKTWAETLCFHCM